MLQDADGLTMGDVTRAVSGAIRWTLPDTAEYFDSCDVQLEEICEDTNDE